MNLHLPLASFPGPRKGTGCHLSLLLLEELKFLGKRLTETTDLPIILSSTACNTVLLTHSGKSKLKCGQVVKEFAVGFGGKGGGSDSLAQALFTDVEIMRNFVNIALHSV